MEYGLSLGSNLGDRLATLQQGRDRIAALPGMHTLRQSAVYETAPVSVRPEYDHLTYLNAVLVINATLAPKHLSREMHAIEDALGRIRTEDRFVPRTLDIDILYAGDTLCDHADLTLPHPRWAKRRFVVQPLADLRPDMVFPGDRKTVRQILQTLPEKPAVHPFTTTW